MNEESIKEVQDTLAYYVKRADLITLNDYIEEIGENIEEKKLILLGVLLAQGVMKNNI